MPQLGLIGGAGKELDHSISIACISQSIVFDFQCSVNGRPSLSSNDVLSVQEVDQVGQDPLLVLDGVMYVSCRQIIGMLHICLIF